MFWKTAEKLVDVYELIISDPKHFFDLEMGFGNSFITAAAF